MTSEACSVTLAAGAGNRMPGDMPPKPCCKVGPVSVIENALETYEQAGIKRHVVVVGCRAESVMEEVRRSRSDVLFAYQSERNGTGGAVRCAMDLLASIGAPEHVLICTGDKVVAPEVIRGLMETYAGSRLDLCLVAGSSRHYPVSGRIVSRNGVVAGIVEVPDIKVQQLTKALRSLAEEKRRTTVHDLAELAAEHFPDAAELAVYFPALSALLSQDAGQAVSRDEMLAAAGEAPQELVVGTGPFSLEDAVASQWCNLSVYAGRFEVLREAVLSLAPDNVQGELYFTDAVKYLVSKGRSVGLFRIKDANDVMAFNTLEELEEVRRVHAARTLERVRYPKLERWINWFEGREKQSLLAEAVRKLAEQIGGERPCIVARSPGRVNLMGRHIDHQGGMCNLMAIDREIVVAASPRDDDHVNLWNRDPGAYPRRQFAFWELTTDIVWEDWLRTLDSQFIQRMTASGEGDWANYAKGAALRLQHRFRDRRLRGMDAFVCGDIPVAAGLSSSSALVVAVAEALAELNGLNVRPREFVDLCGEGEWFAGTRGASADHAAIKLAREREVVSFSFFPFEEVGRHPFPEDCAIVVCNAALSDEDVQSSAQRHQVRVACLHMSSEIIREKTPQLAPRIRHLRDVSPQGLGISLPALYHLLKHVPTRIGPEEAEGLARKHRRVARCLAGLTLGEQEFPLRDVALYGVAECERARRAGRVLGDGDASALGEMMNVSHDGDRRVRWTPDPMPFDSRATDEFMDSLVERSASLLQPLEESGASLWQQPGAYGSSRPEIDRVVDCVLRCPGVLGAQLAGVGLSGFVMVLVRNQCVESLLRELERHYYEPAKVEPQMFVLQPAQGSQVLTTVEARG